MSKTYIDPIKEFPGVEKMIYSLAWKYSKAYKMPFEDARSEASAGYMKACNNYRPGKGMKFSSWVYFVTWGYMKNHIMDRAKDPLCFMEIDDDLLGEVPDEKSLRVMRLLDLVPPNGALSDTFGTLLMECPGELLEAADSLSTEAQELLHLFWECPAEIINARARPDQVEQARKAHQRKHGKEATERAFQEIRVALREAFV